MAIANIIQEYNKQKEENEELKKLANNKQWISPCYVAQNYIPVSLVEEKIEEYKKRKENCNDLEADVRLDVKIKAYEELLKGDK